LIQELNFDFTGYPKVAAWYKKMQEIPGFDENQAGAKFLGSIIAEKLGKPLF
jgi:glutathione S-transferase